MLVGSKPRRVAVVGGVRIPFARGAWRLRRGRQPGNAHRVARRPSSIASHCAGERLGDVIAGAVIKHSSHWNLARESRARLGPGAGDARHRPAARLRHEPRGRDPDRQQDRARPDRRRHRRPASTRSATRRSCFRASTSSCCCASFRGRSFGERIKPWFGLRPRHFKPVLPGVDRAAHRHVDGPALRTDGDAAGRSVAREQDELALASHRNASKAWADGFMSDLVVPYLGLKTDNNVRADTSLEKLAKLKPAFARGRHADRRQQHADDRRRGRRAARERGMGARAQPAGAGVPDLRQGRGGRFRRRRGPADGARLRGAAHAGRCRPHACRTSTSTRSTRPSRRRCCAR